MILDAGSTSSNTEPSPGALCSRSRLDDRQTEAEASSVTRLRRVRPGELLDFCAAPGGGLGPASSLDTTLERDATVPSQGPAQDACSR